MGQVSVKFPLPYKGFYNVFVNVLFYWSLETENFAFISERDVRQNDFRTPRWLSAVFVSENQDMMLRFQSRDKWT